METALEAAIQRASETHIPTWEGTPPPAAPAVVVVRTSWIAIVVAFVLGGAIMFAVAYAMFRDDQADQAAPVEPISAKPQPETRPMLTVTPIEEPATQPTSGP
jgi:hypothetical protein